MTDPISFDYIVFPVEHRRPIPRPVANLTFENQGIRTSFFALIDSGADYSVSFVEFGLGLGIKFDVDNLESVDGVTATVMAYRNPITVLIDNNKVTLDVLWLKKKFDITKDFPFIIGRIPFFDKFDITFQQSKNKFFLKPSL